MTEEVLDFSKKDSPEKPKSMTPENALGFVTVVGPSLPACCDILNRMGCDGLKEVKIHQTMVVPGAIQGHVQIHILAEVRLVGAPRVDLAVTLPTGPTPA